MNCYCKYFQGVFGHPLYFLTMNSYIEYRPFIITDRVCMDNFLQTDQWFYPGTPVSSNNKTDCHYITEILLKVALNTITLTTTIPLLQTNTKMCGFKTYTYYQQELVISTINHMCSLIRNLYQYFKCLLYYMLLKLETADSAFYLISGK